MDSVSSPDPHKILGVAEDAKLLWSGLFDHDLETGDPNSYERSVPEIYSQIFAVTIQDVPFRRFRRGRGARQVVGVNGSDNPNDLVC